MRLISGLKSRNGGIISLLHLDTVLYPEASSLNVYEVDGTFMKAGFVIFLNAASGTVLR